MNDKIEQFAATWAHESDGTQKCLDRLTDASLGTSVNADGRTIARLAWHITQTIPEMMGRTGLAVSGPGEHEAPPAHAAQIAAAYRTAATSLVNEIRARWTDASLEQQDEMYGEMWSRSQTLRALVAHQIHHRGQLTILMRLAGLAVPGIYGPAREEWAGMGMEPPAI
ncbi:MAG TPA: DinB family protein [Gemmatimonadaceae bacterium]|nr:MAG: hypothetical protein ABS52_08485 [Gemmatimonadetes bacterium SCN 70-22]HMN10061.1 DinB family protein [Gemmatimonadaceae bacterium]